MPSVLGGLAPGPVRRRLARRRPLLEDVRVMRFAMHAQRNHRVRLPAATPFTDDELRRIAVPTTAIVAGHSAPFDPRIQAERASLIPGARVGVVPGAGHEISWSHVDLCMEHLLAMLV
jgi:pimeloyl-ACP methyl ester carboxylesterase